MDYVCVTEGCDRELVAVTDSLCGGCGARTWWNDAAAIAAIRGTELPVRTMSALETAEPVLEKAPVAVAVIEPVAVKVAPMPMPDTVAQWDLAEPTPTPTPTPAAPAPEMTDAVVVSPGHTSSRTVWTVLAAVTVLATVATAQTVAHYRRV